LCRTFSAHSGDRGEVFVGAIAGMGLTGAWNFDTVPKRTSRPGIFDGPQPRDTFILD